MENYDKIAFLALLIANVLITVLKSIFRVKIADCEWGEWGM